MGLSSHHLTNVGQRFIFTYCGDAFHSKESGGRMIESVSGISLRAIPRLKPFNQLRLRVHPELAEDRFQVAPDRVRTEIQDAGNSSDPLPHQETVEHVTFTRREAEVREAEVGCG